MLESRGNLYLRRSVFVAVTASDIVPIVSYRADRDNSFLEIEDVNFTCPVGYKGETLLLCQLQGWIQG